ncbi:MAG: AAA family ATPase [Anaerolineae bacterium]|nr:AAA family ATPase [Anaerolineae bacterium]
MKILSLQLFNFKRFSHLKIDNIPSQAKLVLLIGSNGSGKSCIFDAFGFADAAIKRDTGLSKEFFDYFVKKNNASANVSIFFNQHPHLNISSDHFTGYANSKKLFYGRTSFRQIPRLIRTALGQGGQVDFDRDSDRPHFFIERDQRFENDIEKITETLLKDFFRSKQSNEQITEKYIAPINRSLQNIFGTQNGTCLQLLEIIPPLEGRVAQITFRKGESEFHYNYLSAGEKEVFNLLINLLSRAALYQDTIFYLDELDLHLNTRLQFNLLKEIVENWIPDNSQLWTASHSLGFIEYAKQSDLAAIIDLDDLDFDRLQTLYPESKDNPEVYEIAVGKEFLASLFRQMLICFVENTDQDLYASIGIPNTVFVADKDRNRVFHKVRTDQGHGIVDRDFLSDDDIKQIKQHYPKLHILTYYSIENYLYHPDNLAEYYVARQQQFDKSAYIQALTNAKNTEIKAIKPTLALKRTEYPYFGESIYDGKSLQNRFKNKQENNDQATIIADYLDSDDFETFYKVLSMKTYCRQLPQRQNLRKSDLAKTSWFKYQIMKVLDLSNPSP